MSRSDNEAGVIAIMDIIGSHLTRRQKEYCERALREQMARRGVEVSIRTPVEAPRPGRRSVAINGA